MFAHDNSNPEKSTPVIVTVFVYRDLSAPVFLVGNRTASVSENAPVGTSVSNLVATDNDRVASIFKNNDESSNIAIITVSDKLDFSAFDKLDFSALLHCNYDFCKLENWDFF